jgi:hypothetical protein
VISWSTTAIAGHRWKIKLDCPQGFNGDLVIHIHPSDGHSIQTASAGKIVNNSIHLPRAALAAQSRFEIDVD